jgi:hypothetical protein
MPREPPVVAASSAITGTDIVFPPFSNHDFLLYTIFAKHAIVFCKHFDFIKKTIFQKEKTAQPLHFSILCGII